MPLPRIKCTKIYRHTMRFGISWSDYDFISYHDLKNPSGRRILEEACKAASKKTGLVVDTVDHVADGDRVFSAETFASLQPEELNEMKNCKVYVAPPDGTGRWDRHENRISELEKQVKALTGEVGDLRVYKKELDKIAVRCMLDATRNKILGRKLKDDERGTCWNKMAKALPHDSLNGFPPYLLGLTFFGGGTQQRMGSDATHKVSLELIRLAVVSHEQSDLFKEMFAWVYSADPDKAIDC